ncbi:hypothetical protein AF335_16960 [Streptomyces eurocidicus]|uniref:Uncharacterized protein n=1 Tax=Streptomyces eurocidicus TaxID=66423 RepID=A0A2N8NU78_STREU|nr:hypothetical protein AF335_16960 [Streptomyces eurocidicus]
MKVSLLFGCMTARGDELFELTDALLCADEPVTSPGARRPDPPLRPCAERGAPFVRRFAL